LLLDFFIDVDADVVVDIGNDADVVVDIGDDAVDVVEKAVVDLVGTSEFTGVLL